MRRRDILKFAGGAVLNGALIGGFASALSSPAAAKAETAASRTAAGPAQVSAANAVRRLSLINLHTGDTFSDAYAQNGVLIPDALQAITHVMRDHRSNEEHAIDPRLLNMLCDLRGDLETNAPYQIISGYRSPTTNARMHAASSGVASRSLHMDGRAIDIRVRGVQLSRVRDAALARQTGGVGFYETSDFVHVDTGRVRQWAGS